MRKLLTLTAAAAFAVAFGFAAGPASAQTQKIARLTETTQLAASLQKARSFRATTRSSRPPPVTPRSTAESSWTYSWSPGPCT